MKIDHCLKYTQEDLLDKIHKMMKKMTKKLQGYKEKEVMLKMLSKT